MVDMNCKICDTQNKKIIELKEMMFGTGEVFQYFECKNCGCIQIPNKPINLERFYPENYYTTHKVISSQSFLKLVMLKARMALTLNGMSFLIPEKYNTSIMRWSKIAKLRFNSRILDVGCGNGDLLYRFRKNGFRKLYGVDPYSIENNNTNKIEILKKDLLSLHGKYDLIIFNHSFEHIWEQVQTLNKTNELLYKTGVLVLSIPIINEAFRIYKENWIQLDPPRHFFLHTRGSILQLAKNCGFNLIHEYYDSTPLQFLGSEQALKGIPLYSPKSYKTNLANSIFSDADLIGFKDRSDQLNKAGKGDQATFIFKKAIN